MNRTQLTVTITSVMAAILLSACGGGESSSSSTSTAEKTNTTVEQTTKVVEAKIKTPAKEASIDPLLKRGKIVWFKCRSCHETAEGRPHKVGPSLYGLMGAQAGVKEGFVFSDAMKNSGIVWNNDTLDAFIEKPASYIKGTKMAFVGISKESDRQALIKYIEENTK